MITRTQFFAISRTQRLKQGVMLGVRRQDAGPCLSRPLHEEVAGANQTLLVGKRDGRATIHSRQRRLQSGRAAYRRHDPIRRARSSLNDGAFARPAFDARPSQCILQFRKASRIGNGRKPRPKLLGKLRESLDVGMSRQRFHLVALRRSPQQIHGAVADRPGGAKDGHRANGGRRSLVVTQRNSAHVITKP